VANRTGRGDGNALGVTARPMQCTVHRTLSGNAAAAAAAGHDVLYNAS